MRSGACAKKLKTCTKDVKRLYKTRYKSCANSTLCGQNHNVRMKPGNVSEQEINSFKKITPANKMIIWERNV